MLESLIDSDMIPLVLFSITTLLSLSLQSSPAPKEAPKKASNGPQSQYISGLGPKSIRSCYSSLIGNTPLIHLPSISRAIQRVTGLNSGIYLKLESSNPGGTGKDRIALSILNEVLNNLGPGQRLDSVYEGTSGSTGMSLAILCKTIGVKCTVVVPDDQSAIKFSSIKSVGGNVVVTKTASISNPSHYVNLARKLSRERQVELDEEKKGGVSVFVDQFNNLTNYTTHFNTTGPEIYQQMSALGEDIDAFVMSAGTGGTIAGIGLYLKQACAVSPEVILADPEGSVFYSIVKNGCAYTSQQKEATIRKHRYDTICEGIGLDRLTENFRQSNIDDGVKVTDQDVVYCAHYVLLKEGLQIGSSTACNLVASLIRAKVRSSNVVTVMCDVGKNHIQRLWNREFIEGKGLHWPEDDFDWNEWLIRLK